MVGGMKGYSHSDGSSWILGDSGSMCWDNTFCGHVLGLTTYP